jgi:DNA-binding transcriptional LysR family regulator
MNFEPSLLPSLAWFAHVARNGSFTKAATELGVTRAALSQNLKTLEARLNVRLLHRTTRDMSLTEAGRQLLESLLPALAAIEGSIRNLGEDGAEAVGLLRVNSSRIAAKSLIEPHLGEFHARHPKVRLELVMNDGLSNIVADGCDAGIRLGESLAEHMIAVPITPMLEMAVVGSPDYFERHGRPDAPSDLMSHNCLCYRQTTSGGIYKWEFSSPDATGHDFTFDPNGSLITNDDDGMLRAAMQGVGLVQHMNLAVDPWIRQGALERVLAPWSRPFPGFYLYVPSRENMPVKVRALVDFLIEKRDAMGDLADQAPRKPVRERTG